MRVVVVPLVRRHPASSHPARPQRWRPRHVVRVQVLVVGWLLLLRQGDARRQECGWRGPAPWRGRLQQGRRHCTRRRRDHPSTPCRRHLQLKRAFIGRQRPDDTRRQEQPPRRIGGQAGGRDADGRAHPLVKGGVALGRAVGQPVPRRIAPAADVVGRGRIPGAAEGGGVGPAATATAAGVVEAAAAAPTKATAATKPAPPPPRPRARRHLVPPLRPGGGQHGLEGGVLVVTGGGASVGVAALAAAAGARAGGGRAAAPALAAAPTLAAAPPPHFLQAGGQGGGRHGVALEGVGVGVGGGGLGLAVRGAAAAWAASWATTCTPAPTAAHFDGDGAGDRLARGGRDFGRRHAGD